MKSKHFAGFTLLVILMMLLAACAGQAGGSGQAGTVPNLEGTEWVLASLNGNEPITGSTVTLKFEKDQLGGSGGCNSYGGKYTLGPDGKISVSEVVQTEMACMDPAGVMEQESQFGQALSQAASFQMNGDNLEIKNAAGEIILVFAKP